MYNVFSYGNDSIQNSETKTNFDELGLVNLTRMNGSFPFYAFTQGNGMHYYPVNDTSKCNGSCFEYLSKSITIYYG
jgi:hypothetical protein